MKNTELAQIALSHDHTGAIANPIYLSTAYQHPHLESQQDMITHELRTQHAQHLRRHLPNWNTAQLHLQHQVACLLFN